MKIARLLITAAACALGAVGYIAGTITQVGTATYTANDPPNLTGVAPAVTDTAHPVRLLAPPTGPSYG